MKLSYTSIAGVVHCDWLNITFSALDLLPLKTDLDDLFNVAGLSSSGDKGDTYTLANDNGALKLIPNSRYIKLSVSGGILTHLRTVNAFDYLIEIVSKYPHKITRCDVTADFHVSYAPDVLKSFIKLQKASKLQISRKLLARSDYRTVLSDNEHGHETGTLYLGKRDTHSVHCRIYDKGFERRSKGYKYHGEVIRVEFSLKADTGVSLRDVHYPESVFYYYAHRSIATPPPHYVGWEPNGSSYEIAPQKELFTPAGKILNIFKNSLDVARAVKIAITAYPLEPLETLVQQFRIACKLRLSNTPG